MVTVATSDLVELLSHLIRNVRSMHLLFFFILGKWENEVFYCYFFMIAYQNLWTFFQGYC